MSELTREELNARIETVEAHIDKRFGEANALAEARFAEANALSEARFAEAKAQSEARFAEVKALVDARFNEAKALIDETRHFAEMRFMELEKKIDIRAIELRTEFAERMAALEIRIGKSMQSQLKWMVGTAIAGMMAMVAILALFLNVLATRLAEAAAHPVAAIAQPAHVNNRTGPLPAPASPPARRAAS